MTPRTQKRGVCYDVHVNDGSTYIIGIDEAGRGPIAGPVSVGALMVRADFDFEKDAHTSGIRSKRTEIGRAHV